MNTPSFFSAAAKPAAPSALPETHAIELPMARERGQPPGGSFSNALHRAASSRENAPAQRPAQSSSAAPRDAVKPREEKTAAEDSPETKTDSTGKEKAGNQEPDRATLETMAAMSAAAAMTLPPPPVLTVALGQGTALEAAPIDVLPSAIAQAQVMTGPALPLFNQSKDNLPTTPTTDPKAAPPMDSSKPSPDQKPLVELVKPLGMQPLETPKDTAKSAQNLDVAATDAAKAAALKAESAKVEVTTATTQSAPTPEKIIADTGTLPTAVEIRSGMSAAQREVDMRKTVKRSETAEVAEQKLPGAGNSYSFAGEKVMPGAAVTGITVDGRSRNPIRDGGEEIFAPSLNMPTVSVSFSEATPKEISATSAVTPADRVQHLLTTEISRFKQLRLDSMSVVLRPDSHTEISVNLKMNEGRIEAQAICERGDFGALSAGWNQLQQSLARQQIELAPLRDSNTQNGNSDQSGSRGFPQPQGDSPKREEKPKLSFAEELAPLRGATPHHKTAPRPVVTATNGRRWETWA